MERLSNKHLKAIKDYPIRILQFGEGNFLRAFVDWMVYSMNEKANFETAVAVVQPMPQGMIDMFIEQDGLYHHIMNGLEKGEPKSDVTLIDVLKQFVNPFEDYEAYLKLAELDTIEYIVSNTTEAGIAFDGSDTLEVPQNSFPGKLTAWLYKRFQHFNGNPQKGTIILPCELIDKNGEKLKETVVQYSKLWSLGSAFEGWIENANTFTNTLVDRIVPGFPRAIIDEVYDRIQCEDQVVCESERFHLWVIEGPKVIETKLPFKQAGLNVIVTEDMTPYRTRKVRILNGAHTLLVPVGLLYGIDQVRESIEDGVVGKFIFDALNEEVIPTIDMDVAELNQFRDDVLERFRNPYVKHYLKSISLNSTSKFKTRVLPSLLTCIECKSILPKRMLFSLASLIKLYEGKTIEISDDKDVLEYFAAQWAAYNSGQVSAAQMITAILSNQKLWGLDLSANDAIKTQVIAYFELIAGGDYPEILKKLMSDDFK
ncbi:tagaturonate reductase [Fusibacter sp. 3D3]|uniref:tagaturonate reductase n=1 Tax=Fusibacter sp. 3D3 TaxID=1048380 RepID=UPI000853E67D|nr:tagaturonate reductase [Fusibacter sp. 3D3]GAU75732.1 altronate oxidoreductase [Fusibacter sp. 3D3]